MENSIKKINSLIDWYQLNSDKANIDQLLNFQDKLAAETYYIAQSLTKYHSEFTNAYRVRKWTFNKEKTAFIKDKMTAALADAKAHSVTQVLKETEDYNYNIGYKLDIIVRSSDRILKVSQQRISYLKMEFEQTKKQNIT